MDSNNLAIISRGKTNTTGHNASMPSPSTESHDEDSDKSASDQDQNSAEDNAPPVPYRDYSRERKEESPKARRSGKTTQTFPMILHEILSHPEFEDIISWLPHGRAWRIVRHKAFEERVIPLFFRHGRYSSFARQVNGWGFRRITHGTDYNAYYHEMFLRGLPHICNKMRRLTSKDEARVKNEDAPTPDFYSLSRANPLPSDNKPPAKPTLAPAPVIPSSVGPVLGIAAPPFSRGTKALADMSLADLEKERSEILRQIQMRVGASAPESAVLAAQLGSAHASGNVLAGAYIQAPGAGLAGAYTQAPGAGLAGACTQAPVAGLAGAYTQAPGASTPYAIPTGAVSPGPAWNTAPASSMAAAPAETGGISQAALYQALISQLTSATGNQGAPPRAPPPPPPPVAAAPSNQSILEALLAGGNGGGLVQQLLSAGGGSSGGADASNPNFALRNFQMLIAGGSTDANNPNPALRNLQMQLQQATGAPQDDNDSAALSGLQRQPQPPISQQQGRSADPASSMQLQQVAAAPQGGNDNAATSDLMQQYQQAITGRQRSSSNVGGGGDGDIMATIQRQNQQQAMAGHQRSTSNVGGSGDGDIMATIQRQIQQAQANQQRGGGEADDFAATAATIQRQIQQAQASQKRGGGEDDLAATIQRQIQQAQANQQRGGGEDDFAATIQRQIQEQTQRQQQQQLRQHDGATNSNESCGRPQPVAAPSRQTGNGRDAMSSLQTQLQHSDPATRLQLQMLAGRLSGDQSNNNSSSNGTPDIAALAAIMGLPGFPKQSDSGSN